MTKTELLAEIENFKQKDNLPYLNNKEYKRLFLRYYSKEKEEFIFEELIRIFVLTDNDEIKLKILELLYNINYKIN
ncbi:MAG: hypothetical protein ACLUE7_02040 [Lachnospirales bacterium]